MLLCCLLHKGRCSFVVYRKSTVCFCALVELSQALLDVIAAVLFLHWGGLPLIYVNSCIVRTNQGQLAWDVKNGVVAIGYMKVSFGYCYWVCFWRADIDIIIGLPASLSRFTT